MNQYLELLREIRDVGNQKSQRATLSDGTKPQCFSVFGRQIRFNLADGFPLVTTRQMPFKSIVNELAWFLSGSTNANDLDESVQKWWKPWASENGELGPIYGEQLRRSRYWFKCEQRKYDPPKVEYKEGLTFGVGTLGNEKKTHCNDAVDGILKNTWRNMLRRCYYKKAKSYKAYGAKGVHVDPSWLDYKKFKEDAQKIEGWELKLEFPDDYSLDKDIKYASNRYCKDTCIWASVVEQQLNTSQVKAFYATSPEGNRELFPSLGEMDRKYGTHQSASYRCLYGKLKTHKGWKDYEHADDLLRFREVDQIKQVIALIKHNPDSRRIVMDLWHTPAMNMANLPCCHGSIVQFYVANGKLSCKMYQRSADMLLGVPVNISCYSLFTHIIAHITGLEVGEYIHTFGDAHIYENHLAAVDEQLTREPYPLPQLWLSPTLTDIDKFGVDMVRLDGYQSHGKLTGEVAV